MSQVWLPCLTASFKTPSLPNPQRSPYVGAPPFSKVEGCLSDFVDTWKACISDAWVWEVFKGYTSSLPSLSFPTCLCHCTDQQVCIHSQWVFRNRVSFPLSLWQTGCRGSAPTCLKVSKPKVGIHSILDLKVLNIKAWKLCMESTRYLSGPSMLPIFCTSGVHQSTGSSTSLFVLSG